MRAEGSQKSTHVADTKRQRLAAFSRGAYASQSAITSLLSEAKRSGIPEYFSRTTQWRTRKHLCSESTPYGTLVQDIELDWGDLSGATPIGNAAPHMCHVHTIREHDASRTV